MEKTRAIYGVNISTSFYGYKCFSIAYHSKSIKGPICYGILNLLHPYRNWGRRRGKMGIPSKKEMSGPSQICDWVVHIPALNDSDPQMIYIIVFFKVSMITKVFTGIA